MKPFNSDVVRAHFDSALGPMTLAASARGLCGVWFDGQKHQPDLHHLRQEPSHPLLLKTQQQLTDYFAGQRTQFDVALDMQCGTGFQQSVWQQLQTIAPGRTVSYGAIAAALGRPTASRAVGAAVGRNPVSIIVPCHRVVGSSGALTGYAGGLDRKTALLHLESSL
ncbi:MAG: methylated-DNA--[protein]-cysteine S-methyltransferase [Rhodoferax sp.]